MFSASAIDTAVVQAYRETEYRVSGPGGFTLRIDEPSPELLRACTQRGVTSSAFITAWNPFSRRVTPAENLDRQARLIAELGQRQLRFIEGIGQHPSNDWPGEPSLLIFGITLEQARELGVAFEQNAVIWAGADAVPQLVLLR